MAPYIEIENAQILLPDKKVSIKSEDNEVEVHVLTDEKIRVTPKEDSTFYVGDIDKDQFPAKKVFKRSRPMDHAITVTRHSVSTDHEKVQIVWIK